MNSFEWLLNNISKKLLQWDVVGFQYSKKWSWSNAFHLRDYIYTYLFSLYCVGQKVRKKN